MDYRSLIYTKTDGIDISYRAHQIGSSLAVLRQLRALGVWCMILTHTCRTAFAYSAVFLTSLPSRRFVLSKLGQGLIVEMNR